jgi:hypothetical protein
VTETQYLMCPVCWDRAIVRIDGVQLVVAQPQEQHHISQASIYHCSKWHYFAVFHQEVSFQN